MYTVTLKRRKHLARYRASVCNARKKKTTRLEEKSYREILFNFIRAKNNTILHIFSALFFFFYGVFKIIHIKSNVFFVNADKHAQHVVHERALE